MENPKNLIIVIFGASGDLTSRKLIPAIFSLNIQKLLPAKYAVVGIGRTKLSNEDFRAKMSNAIVQYSEEKVTDLNLVSEFVKDTYYHSMDSSTADDYTELKSLLKEIDNQYQIGGNYIFYMATPPSLYESITINLSKSGLCNEEEGFR
ncbi:MAG TPA: glucose-6-phosphate dehydrogenase, partial [Bacteroidales bacterium]|nr:glucose-6-phosphate dehydrogenase [Bacteroidales bacterium]